MGLFTETMYRLDARDNADLAHLDDSEEKVTSVLQILRERLRTFTPNELKIRLDGQDLSGQYILLEVMNISYVGPNLCLAPTRIPVMACSISCLFRQAIKTSWVCVCLTV
jgi:diacylglycerol kinase (ATP)